MAQQLEKLKSSLNAQLFLLNSGIDKEDALGHINYYRQDLPENSIRSIYFDSAIIDFIAANAIDLRLSGLRIYLAKYDENFTPARENETLRNKLTAIIVPTMPGTVGNMDVPYGYFNYGSPCPPEKCDEDEGSH